MGCRAHTSYKLGFNVILLFALILGLSALNGHVVSGDVYAWAAVLILPINSALNPFLYTFSAIIGQKVRTPFNYFRKTCT